MTLDEIRRLVKDCECGEKHECDLEVLEISSGALSKTAEILTANRFPKKILVVGDENSLAVTDGLIPSLEKAGFEIRLKKYPSLRVAEMEAVVELQSLLDGVDGLLSVGTGSVNDICRLASYRENKQLAIFATAPSMDGFASDSAPITKDNFKISYACRQPRIIIADTAILAKAPLELKASGFGDLIAKFIALADWRVANIVHGDYYCERVAGLVRRALADIVKLAPRVREESEDAVRAVMETLVLTGVAMQFTKSSRPASGAEHIISHFWECKKLANGNISDFHGKKVGVATLVVADIYHKLCKIDSVKASKEKIDFDALNAHYGKALMPEVINFNTPKSIVDEIEPAVLEEKWGEIKKIIKEEIPPVDELLRLYSLAGAVTRARDIEVDETLFDEGIRYHAYMRRRVTITRLLPMLNLDALDLYRS